MTGKARRNGLRSAFAAARGSLVAIGAFSFVINLLMLTGPVYMLQVYDRVLTSQSASTLVALSLLVAALFIGLALLEFVRSGLLGRVGRRIDRRLSEPVFNAAFDRATRKTGVRSDQAMRDVRQLRQFVTGPVLPAMFDAPWTPAFLALIWLMHWSLGVVALLGGAILIALAIATEAATKRHFTRSNAAAEQSASLAGALLRNAETVDALGMRAAMRARWAAQGREAEQEGTRGGDRLGAFTAMVKAFRLLLQSAMLGLGAYLAIRQEVSPGVMIASSIILGRALAPIEQGVGQWRSIVSAREASSRLSALLRDAVSDPERLPLPRAAGVLTVENLYAGPPHAERPVLRNLAFSLGAGEALGVIGPSAAGKSTLARVLVGVWKPSAGTVRLDGADVAQWPRDDLGPQLGYLPQEIELFSGTVAQNIARFAAAPDAQAVVEAAQLAGCHAMILALPSGYDTEIGENGRHVSAGQRQRIGLARALYGLPALVVLDEPNSNLDAVGDAALDEAVRRLKAAGRTVVVIAHRPGAVARMDKILVLEDGELRAFGPRERVLGDLARPKAEGRAQLASVTA